MPSRPTPTYTTNAAGRFGQLMVPTLLAERWSLSRRLALAVGVVLAVVMFAFGGIAYSGVRQAAVEQVGTRLESVTRELAAGVQRTGGPRLAAMARAASAAPAQLAWTNTPLGVSETARIHASLDTLLRTTTVGNTAATDSTLLAQVLVRADGDVRFSTAAMSAKDSLMLAQAANEAVKRDTIVRSPFYIVNDTVHFWTIVPGAQSLSGDRAVRQRVPSDLPGPDAPPGVIAELRRVQGSAQAEKTIQTLTGSDMHVMLTSEGMHEWTSVTGVPQQAPFVLPAYDTLTVRIPDARGGPAYAVQRRIAGTPWILVATQRERSIMVRPFAFLRSLLAAGGLLMLVGIACVLWFARRETRPLAALRDASLDVAQGHYASRVPLAGGSEIASLAYMFNAMAARIGDQTAVLERNNVALVEANQAKARFLAVMSHELRTPLNAIGGYVDLIRHGVYGPTTPEQLESLGRVHRSKDQLLHIVSDILQYSKLDAGHLTLRRETVDLSHQFVSVGETLGEQAASNKVTLRIEPTRLQVCADTARLQQVLLNLVTNAVRFTPAGGTVTLSAAELGGTTSITVRDTGEGIPTDQLERIFEPFLQVDSSLTRKVGGTGLGLTIVRDLTTGMGGSVRADSVPGEGATFTVTLETAGPAGPAGASPVPAAAQAAHTVSPVDVRIAEKMPTPGVTALR